jgi:hypothetical protein
MGEVIVLGIALMFVLAGLMLMFNGINGLSEAHPPKVNHNPVKRDDIEYVTERKKGEEHLPEWVVKTRRQMERDEHASRPKG